MTETALPGDLVDTAWLAAHIEDPRLRVVDIRGYVKTADLGGGRQRAEYVGARDEYEVGHIPGAVYVDWTTDITDPDNPVKAQLAPPERFAAAMARNGVGDETDVVAVDHGDGHFATRLWWALRYYGHDRVAVLDGGYAKWMAEGRPLTRDEPRPPATTFTPRPRRALRVEVDEVAASIGKQRTILIDARDGAQYRGETVRGRRGGHIPSAINVPLKSLLNADKTWRSPEEHREMFREAGIAPEARAIAYCNGGVTATGVLFALHRAGHPEWANYDGSWNEWGERTDLPIKDGEAP